MARLILAKHSESIRIASVSKYVGVMLLPKMTDERTKKTVVGPLRDNKRGRHPLRDGLAIALPCTDAMRAQHGRDRYSLGD